MKYAGKWHNGVFYKANGYPDFSPYAIKRVVLDGGQKGNRTTDFTNANAKAGLNSTPNGYTWHHNEDGITMELIPTSIHQAARHTGGVAVLKEAKAIAISTLLATLSSIADAAEYLDYTTYISSGNQYMGPDGKLYTWDEYAKKFLGKK